MRKIINTIMLLILVFSCGNEIKEQKKDFVIGITQIVSHQALDDTRLGFKDKLKELGLSVDYIETNANGDIAIANLNAKNLVNNNVDLIYAVATPVAKTASNATSTIPIVFSAVTDNVSAGITASNVTGVLDAIDPKIQIKELLKVKKDIKKLGFIYNSSEENSLIQLKRMKKVAKEFDIEVVGRSVTQINEVSQVIDILANECDAIYTPSDNLVASSIELIASRALAKKIITMGAEKSHVDKGILMSMGINYYELGQMAAQKAYEILKEGKSPKEIKVSKADNLKLSINKETEKKLNITSSQNIEKSNSFLSLLPESIILGLIYSIMVMGVYITYKILDFPDLTVDGSFPLGGFVFAYFSINTNFPPLVAIIFSFIAGMLAGLITALFHVKLGINKLLSGILTMTALYSINARILGMPSAFIDKSKSWFYTINYDEYFSILTIIILVLLVIKLLYDKRIKPNKNVFISFIIYIFIYSISLIYIVSYKDINMYLLLIIVFIIKQIMDYILTSKFGFILRALGDNEILVSDLGVNVNNIKILGLMLSNGLVAISGALLTQYIRIIDLSSSVGTVVIGLASIIFGLGLINRTRTINYISIIIIGSIVYYVLINIALNANIITGGLITLKPTDVKLITSLFLAIILGLGYMKRGSNA